MIKKLLTTVSNGTFYHSSISGILLSRFTLPDIPRSIAPCELRRVCSLQYRFTTLDNDQTVIKTSNFIIELMFFSLSTCELSPINAKSLLSLTPQVQATESNLKGS